MLFSVKSLHSFHQTIRENLTKNLYLGSSIALGWGNEAHDHFIGNWNLWILDLERKEEERKEERKEGREEGKEGGRI